MAGFPAHPFWEFSLRLYRAPGVAEACLALQERCGADVNVALFCLWSGAAGHGRLEADALTRLMRRAVAWQEDVVLPLRRLRRTLKHGPADVGAELRAVLRGRVAATEIDAEHVEQLMLAEGFGDPEGPGGADDAAANLQAYLERLGCPPDDPDARRLLDALGRDGEAA